jgi:hypothetical protein
VTAEHGKHPGARGLSIEVDPEEALVNQSGTKIGKETVHCVMIS